MPGDTSIDLKAVLMRIEKPEAELARTKAELALATAEIARKDQIIAWLQQQLFGSKSERLDPNQISLDFEDSLLGKPEPSPGNGDNEGALEEQEDDASKAKRKRRRKADRFPKNLPIIIAAVDIPDEVAADPDAFTEIGEEYHDELDVTRAAVFWRRWIRKKFVSKNDRSRPPLMPPAPRPSIPGTHCAPGLMAQLIADKFTDHLPHYRQEQRFLRQHKVELSRQTINCWTHATADLLTPIGQAIKLELLGNEVLQVDEWSGAT